ncbi:MAG: hypothetical protein ACKD6M_04510 [Candidatus Bathyarchaeota archaeon]
MMVLAGKIFKVKEKVNFKKLIDKLENLKSSETYTENGFSFTLMLEVKDLSYGEGFVKGRLLRDEVTYLRQKEQTKPVLNTGEFFFSFHKYKNTVLLTILGKKWKANKLANILSEKIFGAAGFIVEVKVSAENLKKYHEKNFEGTKIVLFNGLSFPGVKKLSLYGEDIKNSSLYKDFLSRGEIWYIVLTSKKYGYTVGLTGNGVVTIFDQLTQEEFLNYIKEEVFPLIQI